MNHARTCYHCKKPIGGDEIFCRHCGTRLRDTGLQPGQVVGKHYRIEDVIGQGGMGQVVKAIHELTGQVVAIKTLSPHLAADPGLRERFLQEARALAGMDHPNIMTLYTFLEEEGKLFLVMQYIDGQDVDAMFRRCGGISPRAAIPIFKSALQGLGYAHRQGIIHRDLKPANIMVTRDGRVKLTDFGIALMTGGLRLTVTGAQVGTVFYMAPEQIQGSPATPRSDLYAMGISLFEVLTGRLPFAGEDYAVRKGHVEDPVPDVRMWRPDIPEYVAAALFRALSKRPEQRFQTAEEFCDQIGHWGDVLPLVDCPLCAYKHPVGEGVSCPSCGKDELCRFHMVDEYHMCRPCVQLDTRTSSLHDQPELIYAGKPNPSSLSFDVSSSGRNLSSPAQSVPDLPYHLLAGANLHNEQALSHEQSGNMSAPKSEAISQAKSGLAPTGHASGLVYPVAQEARPPSTTTPPLAPSETPLPSSLASVMSTPLSSHGSHQLFPENTHDYRSGSSPQVGSLGTLSPRPTSAGGTTLPPDITTRDRAEMVLISEGYFIMGTHDEPNANPPKRCYLRSYYVDRYPVTNAGYERFVRETGHPAPKHWLLPEENGGRYFSPDLTLHPVVYVSYHDALAYCRWAGKRLPTEAEWEKAARGTDSRLYPWGSEWMEHVANFGTSSTCPAPSHAKGKSPYGVCDTLGNVWEWVADWYAADSYQREDETSPTGPKNGKYRVIRGGGYTDPPRTVRVTTRNFRPPHLVGVAVGFRCVMDP